MTFVPAVNTLTEYFYQRWELSEGGAFALAAFIHAFVLINFFAVLPLFYIWLERKVAGRIQDRMGPTRVGGRFGWLQTLADGIKLIQKEDLAPEVADRMLFRMSPYIAVVAAFSTFMLLPFSNGWVAVALDISVFAILALSSLEVLGIVLAGYSSGSKWSLFGGMREAAQMVSYEIPLAICVLIPLITAGSLSFTEVVWMQAGPIWRWMIFQNPFTFLTFFVFFAVATAEVKRAPFDLAEAESELVAGFHTEYSGIRWSFFFMAEYASMFAVGGIGTLLFLGGWHSGIGIETALAPLRGVGEDVITEGFVIGEYIANAVGALIFITKSCVLVFVQIWVRWTLPRLRIDQVMMTCLKYLVPISCFLFLGAILWPLVLVLTTGRTTVFAGSTPVGQRAYVAREVTREVRPVDLGSAADPSKISEAERVAATPLRGEAGR